MNVSVRRGEKTQMSDIGRDVIRGGIGGVIGIPMPTLHVIILYIPGESVRVGV